MLEKLTTRSLFLDCNWDISQASLLFQVTLSYILYTIWCTDRSANIGASRTYTFRFVVHHSTPVIVWSSAAFSLARIYKNITLFSRWTHSNEIMQNQLKYLELSVPGLFAAVLVLALRKNKPCVNIRWIEIHVLIKTASFVDTPWCKWWSSCTHFECFVSIMTPLHL